MHPRFAYGDRRSLRRCPDYGGKLTWRNGQIGIFGYFLLQVRDIRSKRPGATGALDSTQSTSVEYLELGASPKPRNTLPGSGDPTPRPTNKQHIIVERCINNLDLFRARATRYDKRNCIYLGPVDVTTIRVWLRDPVHGHGQSLRLLHGPTC